MAISGSICSYEQNGNVEENINHSPDVFAEGALFQFRNGNVEDYWNSSNANF